MQLFSAIGISIYIALSGIPSPEFLIRGSDLVIIVLIAGVLNVFGLMQLYRAFSIGNMSIAAPIASSYPIFTILFGFIILGEGVGLEKGIAIAIVVSGVILTGISHQGSEGLTSFGHKGNMSTVASALTASVFFGATYLILDVATGYLGSILIIWFLRIGAVLFSFPVLLLATRKFLLPVGGAWKWLLLMALLDSSGFATLTLGYIYAGNSSAIVTTLSSLLGAVTTILAAVVYKDRLNRIQILGIFILFLGVITVLNV